MIREFLASETTRSLVIITNTNEKLQNELENRLHYRADPRIRFVGSVYDQELLSAIRRNAFAYLHGHEVGGTNPSLLEALGATDLSLLLDVPFNREVAGEAALYWTKDAHSLAELVDAAEKLSPGTLANYGLRAKDRVRSRYSWQFIADQYSRLFLSRNKPSNEESL